MNVAVIGGGINGVFCAWRLSESGHQVDLYEAHRLMSQTSSSSSKLLHGGIRYLEHGQLALVGEALSDRAWWLENAPHATRPIEIGMPVYKDSRRGLFTLFVGAQLYRMLARRNSLGNSKLFWPREAAAAYQELKKQNLSGVVTFYDGQMNEEALERWVADKAIEVGIKVYERQPIEYFNISGVLDSGFEGSKHYDFVINAAGPWAEELNKRNNIKTNFSLNLVRGSHLLIDYQLQASYLFQDPDSKRIVYVWDYFGDALIGTTEIPQKRPFPPVFGDDEREFLIEIFNRHFRHQIGPENILREYSGLRPIVCRNDDRSAMSFSRVSREVEIEVLGRLITIYGGKWTSAPSLAKKILKKIDSSRI